MRNTAAVTGIAALGLGLVVTLVFRFRPDAESAAPPQAAPTREVKAEASAVDPRDGDADAPRQESPLAPSDRDVVARPAPTEERAPLRGEAPATPMAAMIELERAFSVEPIDAAWAPGAEADLLAKFAQMQGLKLIDLRVECRSTMCRAVLTQPLPAPGEPLFDRFDLLTITLFDPSGAALKSFAYVWRDGFGPPPPGQSHDTN